ncbi:MAG: SEC-C domain-containing protein [Candidatus Peribacteraceae bacterium]|nr:SEC-C domain-containing protein [Candidatus Peribacteraceae bacterium]MBP9850697.1 SEC-C domain-containing protein [Candidatus Peribacteraceae bacterium]
MSIVERCGSGKKYKKCHGLDS